MRAISSRSIRCHPPGALVLAGLLLVVGLAIPGYTQTVTSKKSSTDKKETTVTPLAIAQVDSDPYNAIVEIRAFHANVPEDQTRRSARLSITHGCPGSIIEQLKIVGPLTDPTAYGGVRRNHR